MENNLEINLLQGLRVQYKGPHNKVFIEIINPYTGFGYTKTVKRFEVFHVNIMYPAPWIIRVYRKKTLLIDTQVSYNNAPILIHFATTALGDTLAWVPCVQRWIELNNPSRLYLVTSHNYLFDKSKYSDKIVWCDTIEDVKALNPIIYVQYVLGIPREHELSNNIRMNHANPVSWKDSNMIDTINYTFGLEPIHRKPHLQELPKERLIPEPYISVCLEGSQFLKYIQSPLELSKFMEYIKSLGIRPILVGNKTNIIPWMESGIANDITQAMRLIRDSEFFIGFSSGLAWVANAYNKPVLMITNFTLPGYEFQDNITRVCNTADPQLGVFNNKDIPWIPEPHWDPYQDGMQLCKNITCEMMIQGLHHLLHKKQHNISTGTYLHETEFRPIQRLIPEILPKMYTLTQG